MLNDDFRNPHERQHRGLLWCCDTDYAISSSYSTYTGRQVVSSVKADDARACYFVSNAVLYGGRLPRGRRSFIAVQSVCGLIKGVQEAYFVNFKG